MDTNKTACNCHNVRYQMIIDAVKDGADTYEKLQEMTGCGTGCGQCSEGVSFNISVAIFELLIGSILKAGKLKTNRI